MTERSVLSARELLVLAVVAACAACSVQPVSRHDSNDSNDSGDDTPGMARDTVARINALTPDERAQGWRLLFDGRSTTGWRGYKRSDMPSGWTVVDSALTRTGDGGDIVSIDQFGNFELAIDWKVAPAANSGIMYRVAEGPDEAYMSGPEMQVLDDERHPDGQSRLTSAGAAYGLYPAPAGVVRPAGEWNGARLVVNGTHVEHWLNGSRVVTYELGSPDWEQRVKRSKFAAWPTYGRASSGHIALQDHGDRVAFRNIKIRVLP